jgi:peptide/nickel transport system substrate-binding protein
MQARIVAAVGVTALVLAACGGGSPSPASGGPKQGGTLTTAIGIDADTLDPAAQTTTTVSQMVRMMTEPLVAMDQKGTIQPLLATSWESSADGLTHTFTLRRGVRFSDGEPFNAQAVKFSMDRLLSPSTFKAQPMVLRVIKQTRVVDDSHVEFDLTAPFAPFVAAIAQSQAAIIAPDSANRAPNTPSQIVQPVGTGPYVFKERLKSDHLTMVRNPAYWGRKPSYQTQVYKVVPEAASREALIKAGQADIAYLPPASDFPALQRESDVHLIMGPSDRTVQIVINTQDRDQPLLQNPQVRQALNYAVDKQTIVQKALFGAAQPVNSPMASSLFGYCRTGDYAYSPSKARGMLQAAGAAGMSLKLMSPQGRYIGDYDVAQAVAGDLRAAGLKVTVPNPSDWPTYLSTVNVASSQASTDLHLLGWASQYMDASGHLVQFERSQWPPAGLATSYYDSPSADALIQRANTESNTAQRAQDYCQAEKTIWNAAPWIFLYNQKNPILTTTKVTGVYGLPNEQFVTTWASPT